MTPGDAPGRDEMAERYGADVVDLVSSWAGGEQPEGDALNDPWHVAVHEAGHAVVGRKLGLDMGQASALQDEDSAGHSLVGDPWATLDRWWTSGGRPYREFRSVVRARVLMLMAGAEAEVAILGRCEGGDGGNRREIDLVMESHPGDPVRSAARLASLRRSATRLVRRHRADIEAVAVVLRDRGTVPGDELDAMVPGPPDGPENPAWRALLDAEPQGEAEMVRLTASRRNV